MEDTLDLGAEQCPLAMETAEDFQPIPSKSEQYCFLCKYGGFDGVNLGTC